MNLISGEPAAKRGATTIGIRPEHVDVSHHRGRVAGAVRLAEHLGSDTFVYAEADGIGPMTVRLDGEAPLQAGRRDLRHAAGGALHKFDQDGRRIG